MHVSKQAKFALRIRLIAYPAASRKTRYRRDWRFTSMRRDAASKATDSA
jgi:hypothetical protein